MALRDTEAAVRKVLGGSELPVLLDPTGRLGSRYSISALPTNVFIDSKGRIAEKREGATTASELAELTASLR